MTLKFMKPETRRLIILDIILGSVCVLQIFRGVSPGMHVPVLLAQFELLGYGLYLLIRAEHMKKSHAR